MQTVGIKGFLLSPQQAHLWRVQQGNPAYYRAQCAVLLKGTLDFAAWQQALQHLVDRYEILRTLFQIPEGMEAPVQVIGNPVAVPCPVIHLETFDEVMQAKTCDELFESMWHAPLDPVDGLSLSFSLVRLSPQAHLLLYCLPALCADASTLQQVVTELLQSYEACLQGDTLQQEEPLQYIDVAAWQHELLQDEEQRAYWQKFDPASLDVQPLPLAGTVSRVGGQGRDNSFAPEYVSIELDETLQAGVRALAQRSGASCEEILCACWQVLLWRLTDLSPYTIGALLNGRSYEDLLTAIGLYAKAVPLSIAMNEELSFEHVLKLVQAALSEITEEQIFFSWSGKNQQTRGYFPVSYEYEVWPGESTIGGLSSVLQRRLCYTEPFELKLYALQSGQRITLEIHYNTTRFDSASARTIGAILQTLLQQSCMQPQLSIGSLALVSPEEKQRLRLLLAGPRRAIAQRTLQQSFEAYAARMPEQVAVICGAEQLTYRQLNGQANRLARYLRRLGVGPNRMVGICMERSIQMITALLAILKAGGAYVPLDPEHPMQRLQYQLDTVNASVVLTQERLLSSLSLWHGDTICLDRDAALYEQELETDPEAVNGLQDLAYVMYTSGSTGQPKGVKIKHESVINYTQSLGAIIAPVPQLHFATVSALTADLGNTTIFCALASGGCLHVLPYEIAVAGEAFAHYVSQHPIDVLKIVPSHLLSLLATANGKAILPRQHLVLGGEALPATLLTQLRTITGPCRVINHYGPTETTIGALINLLPQHSESDQEYGAEAPLATAASINRNTVPIGRPIDNTEVYILDRFGKPVPAGMIGELYIGGPGVADGYVRQPELTAERFLSHPWKENARLYRTGDRVSYTADGVITFIGRIDGQLKIRGFRVEPGEIEAALVEHENIREAAIVQWLDLPERLQLVAYVVAQEQPAPMSQELRQFLEKRLPGYMIPSTFKFLRALPLTSNGKIDRRQLPDPASEGEVESTTYAAPRTSLEEIVAGIWGHILKIEKVGIHDNFVEMGGHSLLATQIVSRLRNVLHIEVPLRKFFEKPTVADVAQYIEKARQQEQESSTPPMASVARGEALPLSFAQQRLWFLDQLEPGQASYNIPTTIRLQGILAARALEWSLQEVVRRHEILRTTFVLQDGQPVQQIHPVSRVAVAWVDLTALPEDSRTQEVQQLARQEAQRPFNLERGPLLRTTLLRMAQDEHVLLHTMHHIISDGWSRAIWLQEMTALYNAAVNGKPSPLPDLPIQYADFAFWQHSWLQGEVLDRQLAYWQRQLADIPEVIELPLDHSRPDIQRYHGSQQSITFPLPLTEGLKEVGRREGVTLFMIFLTTFLVLLWRYSDQEDTVVGTPIANRNRVELEGLIGFFANTLVLRTDLSGNPTFRELLKRVRSVTLDAYSHQDVPFEKLVEVLHPERKAQYAPLIQVMFALQQQVSASPEGLTGLTTHTETTDNETSKFDLICSVIDEGQALRGSLHYNSDLFEAETIQHLLSHWLIVLENMLADLDHQIGNFALVSKGELEQFVSQWNGDDDDDDE